MSGLSGHNRGVWYLVFCVHNNKYFLVFVRSFSEIFISDCSHFPLRF